MTIIDNLLADSGLGEAHRAVVTRRYSGILAAGQRLAGRSLLPGTWTETHRPLGRRIWVANPPIRFMVQSYEYDSDTGCVVVDTDDDVTIEYDGGPESLPADIYMAVLALVQGEQRPGVISEKVYDLGAVEFAAPPHPILGHYAHVFERARALPSAIGMTTQC